MKHLGELKTRPVKSIYVRNVVKMTCDICGKELKDEYAKVCTHHNKWGNDSCDSYEHNDLCFDCAKEMFNKYLARPETTEVFEYECEFVDINEQVEMDEKGELYLEDIGHCKIER